MLVADVITAESGIPFLSVKIYLFMPILLLSVGIISFSHRPTKGDFMGILSSSDRHIHLIPFLFYSFSNLVNIF
jgi:hypothetical protein